MSIDTGLLNRFDGKKAILLFGDFHNFEVTNFDALDTVLQEHPNLSGCLPNENSTRAAFTALKNRIEKKKTRAGKIVCIRAKKDDIGTWTWAKGKTLLDGFSVHKAKPDSELGHKSEPEGVVGLAENGELVISITAAAFFKDYDIDPQADFQKAKDDSSGEFRRKFDKFIAQYLGVSACRIAGSAYLVQPSRQAIIDEYLTAIRKLGVDARFISSWIVDVYSNQRVYAESLTLQGKQFLSDLEEKLRTSTKTRQNTLSNDSSEIVSLLDILQEYGVSDSLINDLSAIKLKVDAQLDNLKQKSAAKPSKIYLPIEDTLVMSNACKLHLKSKMGRPQEINCKSLSYDPASRQIAYVDESGNIMSKDGSRFVAITIKLMEQNGDMLELIEIDISPESNLSSTNTTMQKPISADNTAQTKPQRAQRANQAAPADLPDENVPHNLPAESADNLAESADSSNAVTHSDEPELSLHDEYSADDEAESDVDLITYILTKEANGDTPTLSEIYELYDPGVVNEALDNGSIYEYRGLVYAEEA